MPPPQKSKPQKPITYAQILAELRASGELPPAQWVPQQPDNPGYAYETPDPMAQAAHFAQRQEAARQLASPVSPVLELPEDAANVAQKVSPLQMLIAKWWGTKKN